MERKIDEVFEYQGKKLKVMETTRDLCFDCYFYNGVCCQKTDRECGNCDIGKRTDHKSIIFVEVKEEPKERKIGEVFEYEGKKLIVKESKNGCDDCFFYGPRNCKCRKEISGYCGMSNRSDRIGVIFMEVKDEQPQEQVEQPQKLNLCEILKDCPKGTEFWSDNYGEVKFIKINPSFEEPILTRRTDGYTASYTKEGWHSICFPANCLLWPSKDCRDWAKFTAPWLKKGRFDPKTLKAFDRIIVRNEYDEWTCTLFSHINNEPNTRFICATCESFYIYCIPYNDDTKHLVGTTDEAPEYYKYWED